MPRWVKISLAVAAVVVLVVLVALLSGGQHGPGRHLSAPHMGTGELPRVAASARL